MTTDEPAVRTWQDATEAHMAASTAPQARRLTDELDQLRRDYNAVLLERDEAVRRAADFEQVREELRQARVAAEGHFSDYQEWESEKADHVDRSLALKAENERLTAASSCFACNPRKRGEDE
jgi:predicted  nucleic acid-binding Zn-ribbon protein